MPTCTGITRHDVPGSHLGFRASALSVKTCRNPGLTLGKALLLMKAPSLEAVKLDAPNVSGPARFRVASLMHAAA